MEINRDAKYWAGRIIQYRAENQLKQDEFAKKVGISFNTVGKIERGDCCRVSVLVAGKLSQVLGKN